jgi:hypothetical protein
MLASDLCTAIAYRQFSCFREQVASLEKQLEKVREEKLIIEDQMERRHLQVSHDYKCVLSINRQTLSAPYKSGYD